MDKTWQLTHVGILVRDLEGALDYYQSLGIGVRVGLGITETTGFEGAPIRSGDLRLEEIVWGERFVRRSSGPQPKLTEEIGARTQGRLQIGDLCLEVLKAGWGGRHPNEDYLRSHGEGISHINFNVASPEEEMAKLVEKGVRIVWSIEFDGRIGECYLDTSEFGGLWFAMRPPATESYQAWDAGNRAYDGVSNWKFLGVELPVRDLDKAVEYYQSLGIATLQPEGMLDSSSCEEFTAFGRTLATTVKARTRVAQVGPLAYEFVQPLEGQTVYNESLGRRADGIADSMTFAVDDLDKEMAEIVKKGGQVILSGKPRTGGAFAYFDTRRFGNTMVKLLQAK
jgi:catechol 2,3-dioxygenase-like lactoylglutathione lyase family enzyme